MSPSNDKSELTRRDLKIYINDQNNCVREILFTPLDDKWKITMDEYYTITDWDSKISTTYESIEYVTNLGGYFTLVDKTLTLKIPLLDHKFVFILDQRIIEKDDATRIYELEDTVARLEKELTEMKQLATYNLNINHIVEDVNYVLSTSGELTIHFSNAVIEERFLQYLKGLPELADLNMMTDEIMYKLKNSNTISEFNINLPIYREFRSHTHRINFHAILAFLKDECYYINDICPAKKNESNLESTNSFITVVTNDVDDGSKIPFRELFIRFSKHPTLRIKDVKYIITLRADRNIYLDKRVKKGYQRFDMGLYAIDVLHGDK